MIGKAIFAILILLLSLLVLQVNYPPIEKVRDELNIPKIKPIHKLIAELEGYLDSLKASSSKGKDELYGGKKRKLSNVIDKYLEKLDEVTKFVEKQEEQALMQSKNFSQGIYNLTKQLVEMRKEASSELMNKTIKIINQTKELP